MNYARGWSVSFPDWRGEGRVLAGMFFRTRDEAIRYACWNLGEAKVPVDYRGLSPWSRPDSAEISKAWRRIKRKHGMRAVRVSLVPERGL